MLLLCLACLPGLAQQPKATALTPRRIVSLNGSISEILCALGLEQQIVGVDVTSTYPASLKSKPQVGHNRNISAEGIVALNPTMVLGIEGQVSPQLKSQLNTAGIKTILIRQQYSADGVRDMVRKIADVVNEKNKAGNIIEKFNTELSALHLSSLQKKVLFIYARGAGTMLVSGKGTSVEKMITLAGAQNAVTGFSDFKPLSAESLVAANPDVILMFEDGLESMGGIDGLLKVPGISQTNAGRNKKIITMDGALLTGFTIRLPLAVRQLHDRIKAE